MPQAEAEPEAESGADWPAAGDATAADAFHVEVVIDPFNLQRSIGMVRHAGHPFVVAAPAAESEADWFAIAARYLAALRRALAGTAATRGAAWGDAALWQRLVDAAPASDDGGFGWLPITWGRRLRQPQPQRDAQTETLPDAEPVGSFWVPRRADDAGLRDGSLVLLAGRVAYGLHDAVGGGPRHALLLSGDTGLRLTLHVRGQQVHMLGVTLSGLASDRARLPLPGHLRTAFDLFKLVKALREPIGTALGNASRPWLRLLEPVPGAPGRMRAAGHALRPHRWPQPGATAEPDLASAGDRRAQRNALSQRLRAAIVDFSVEVEVGGPPSSPPRVLRVLRNELAGSAATAPPPLRRRRPAKTLSPAASAAPSQAAQQAPGTAVPATAAADALDYRSAHVFLQDPASRVGAAGLRGVRPTRTEPQLDARRAEIDLWLSPNGRLAYATPGADGAPVCLFETRAGRPLPGAGTDQAGTPVDAESVVLAGEHGALPGACPGQPLRTDVQAALAAHHRGAELFQRLAAYGISATGHFRFAELPLVQRARAATRWAPDADLPYAEVRPFLGYDEIEDAQAPRSPIARPQLLVKYGSAEPMHRRLVEIGPANAGGRRRSVAQYQGVAADPRWAWHEFGHVLIYAATGELEFPFAHSAGDALGAIVADPLSALAVDNEAPLRFVSYPWIEVPGRSHGRGAREGYCWCGRRNLVRLASDGPLSRHHHGYFEEQILSSSLFRLYRCLGGDTRGGDGAHKTTDEAMRLEASDFTVHLIVRAISLLGHDGVAPARTADQFVSALIDADAGLGDWRVRADWPLDRAGRTPHRQGGQAHKLIRWAFEQQGLDATDDPTAAVDGPGRPPPVDLFIADARPQWQAGGYAPVPWRWREAALAWHAEPGAVQVQGSQIAVVVRNRGRGDAVLSGGARLRAWWSPATASRQGRLDWRGPTSTALPDHTLAAFDRTPPVAVTLAHPGPAGAQGGWLLVAVDAPADPSLLLPDASLPDDPVLLMHLVAQDNNLALLWIGPGRAAAA